MIRINLLPIKETERAIGRRQQVSLVALGTTVALLIMVVPFILQSRKLAMLEGQIQQVNTEVQAFNAQVKEVHDLDRLKKEVETKLRIIQALNQKRVGPEHVLDDLSVSTPDSLWLTDFTEIGGNATFTGKALDNETIARFMRQLQDSPYFHSVDLVETSHAVAQTTPAGAAPDQRAMFTQFIVKATIDYFGRDGKPLEPPPGQDPPPGQPAAVPVNKEPKA
ncbi:MAG: PilN domain-containing protein [bacterium]